MVSREPEEHDEREGRLVRMARCESRWNASEQLDVDLRRRRLALGTATLPVLPAQLPALAAGSELPQSASARGSTRQRALLARQGRRCISPRCNQFLLSRPPAAR